MSPNALLIGFIMLFMALFLISSTHFRNCLDVGLPNWLARKYGPHVLYLSPKLKYSNDVSFMTTPMGLNQLYFIVNKLTTTFPCLKDEVLSYKMSRNIKIMPMEGVFVPCQYNMEVVGHKDPICYEKSNFSNFFLPYISFINFFSSHVWHHFNKTF